MGNRILAAVLRGKETQNNELTYNSSNFNKIDPKTNSPLLRLYAISSISALRLNA